MATINSISCSGSTHTFSLPYGTCSTTPFTAAKTVQVSNFSLETGARILIQFDRTNTASSPTLNVNSTGAKSIWYRGSNIPAGYLAAFRVYEFVFDGTYWQFIGDLDTNTTYSLSSFGVTATAAELNYVDGVTSNIQTQLNGKAASSHTHTTSQITNISSASVNYATSAGSAGSATTAGKAPMMCETYGFSSATNGFSMTPLLRATDLFSSSAIIPERTYSMIPYVNVTTEQEGDDPSQSWITNVESRFYKCDLNDLLSRVRTLENKVCIKAGTQITLADGTTKNIEDVKYGDTLLGYDVLSDKMINVKSYGIVPTGKAHIWELFAFEDGRTVEIYDTHQLYSETNGRMLESNKWKCGDYGIGVEGEPIQLALTDRVGDAHEDYKYQIYTENGTCFANGILLGHDPWCCYRQYSNCHEDNPWLEDLTEEEVAYFKSLADIYENERRSHLNTREYVKKAAPYFAKINIANQEIEDRKAQLSGQDYKTIKHSQGVLSEEDFALTIADCETLRAEIAEYEAIVEENEAIVTELKNEYTLTEWDRKRIFEIAFAAAMEHVHNNGLN